MSLNQLFAINGHGPLRYVRNDGRVFASTKPIEGALPLTQHKFHGGIDDSEDVKFPQSAWWKADGALDRDRTAVAQHFPSFMEVVSGDENEPPRWTGVIDTGYGRFRVTLSHRADHSIPRISVDAGSLRRRKVAKKWINSPHLFLNGDLCVAERGDWDPERDSVATAIAWTAHWLACHVQWSASGKWGEEGYVESAESA